MTDDSWIDSHLEDAYESRYGGDAEPPVQEDYGRVCPECGYEDGECECDNCPECGEHCDECDCEDETVDRCRFCEEPIDYCQGHGVMCPHCGQYPSEEGHNPWCVTIARPDTTIQTDTAQDN